MTYTYSVTYLPCQICNARIHCDNCECQLEKSILLIPDLLPGKEGEEKSDVYFGKV